MIYKTLLLIFLAANAFSQTQQKYNPQELSPKVLILSPGNSTLEKSLEKEITKNVNDYKKGLDLDEAEKFLQSEEFKSRPENVRLMSRSEVDYLKVLDHLKIISYLAEQHLSYILYDKFPNVVVKLKDAKSTGEKSDLNRIATEEDMMFVLNFSLIELYKEKNEGFARITVQLYDKSTNSILLEKSYTGNSENPGFEYACKDGSVDCCINNALSRALREVAKLVMANDPTARKEKIVSNDRTEVLNAILKQPFDKQALQEIIPASDARIDLASAYQVIFNKDKTQFVAFFAETVPSGNGQAFQDKKDDNNVNVVSEDQMGFFGGKLPNTYAHIVKGVKYEGKWYYEKAEVTYFDAKDLEEGKKSFFNYLQKWNFFQANTAVVNPGFWESTGKGRTLSTTELFGRVPDLTKDPNWEKYKRTLEAQELEDRPYVGMFEIVADQLKAAKVKSGK